MSHMKLWKARRTVIQVTALLAVLVSSVFWAGTSQATPGSGVTVELLASGNLSESVRVKIRGESKTRTDVSQIQTYKITLPPGSYTGWHQHGGPHLIVVASGTLTYYGGHEGDDDDGDDDSACTAVTYSAGSAILDPGFVSHFVRNEGTVEAVTYVTQLLPDGGLFRIDIPAPEDCDV